MSLLPRFVLGCSVIAFGLLGPAPASAGQIKVIASFSIIADMARNVGGDRIALTTLVGADGDAHVYEPEPADAVAMAGADVVLVNGLAFEGFVERLVAVSTSRAVIAEVSKGAELLEAGGEAQHDGHDQEEAHKGEAHEKDGHGHGARDPHAWQSVHNAMVYVRNIAMAFCTADAAGCGSYKANADAYLARLDRLDADIRAAIAALPETKRTVITSHDAFGYFAHEYGIRFLAPEGVSTESEASAADVAALIRQIRQDKASALFVENITDRRLIEQIARETGIQIGGALYSDALSGADGPAASYEAMMRHNAQTIVKAITGS